MPFLLILLSTLLVTHLLKCLVLQPTGNCLRSLIFHARFPFSRCTGLVLLGSLILRHFQIRGGFFYAILKHIADRGVDICSTVEKLRHLSFRI
nr:hypothetical protein Iba_chr15aCG1260 [Ipomoea batatas]